MSEAPRPETKQDRIAAVILAAGSSSRLGRPKQNVILDGETLLECAVRIASEAQLTPILVVARPDEPLSETLRERGCTVIPNEHAAEGIASSIRLGVHAATAVHATGVVLMTCDQVMLQPAHLHNLCSEPATPAGSFYSGRLGIPAYFPASLFASLLTLSGDQGARDILATNSARSIPDPSLSFDLDTPEDLANLTKQAASSPESTK